MKKLSVYIILVLFCFNVEAKAEKNVTWQVFVKLTGEIGNNSSLPSFNAKETSKIKSAKDQKKIVKKTIDKALHKCENSNVKWTISLRGNKICTVTVVKYFDEDNPENNNKYVNLSGIKFDDLIISINGLEKLTPEKIEEIAASQKKLAEEKVANAKNMCNVSKPDYTWTMCLGTQIDILNKFNYVGEWKDGAFHGQGTWTHESGEKYLGEWKFGKRSGQGTLIFPDGYKYVGEFKGGTFNGQGTLTHADGSKKKGIWKNSEILSKKEAKTGNQTQVYNYIALNKSRRLIFLKKDPTTFKNIIFQKEINIRTSKVEKMSQLNKGYEKNFKGFRFIAEYEDNIKIEILIEYDKSVKDLKKAEKKALYFADMFGQMPHILKVYNDKIFVHRDLGKGSKVWWATPSLREFHINEFTCGDYLSYGKDNYSQCSSMMIHELAHVLQNYTSVIPASKWKKARKLDKPNYCSKYAKKNIREDFAESVLCWIGVKYRKDHLHKSDIKKINQFVPNRLKFFDDLNLNMHPYKISN